MTRALNTDELEVLSALLDHDFAGAVALRDQMKRASVFSSCDCGCGSIGFSFGEMERVRPSSAASPLPVEADIVAADGGLMGDLIVLLTEGFLHDVDVFSFVDVPLAFPQLSDLRWRVAP